MDLLSLKMGPRTDIDRNVDRFKELMEHSQTDMKEAYRFLFTTIPDSFKVDPTKYFEGEAPNDMQQTYCRARTLDLTPVWSEPEKNKRQSW